MMCKCLFNPKRELLTSEINSIVHDLCCLLKGKLKGHFSLQWEPVFNLLETYFEKPKRAAFHISSGDEFLTQIPLLKIVQKIKVFFPPEASLEIFNYLKGLIGQSSDIPNIYLLYFICFLRVDKKILQEHYTCWMEELMPMWNLNSGNQFLNSCCFLLFSELAKYKSMLIHLDFIMK